MSEMSQRRSVHTHHLFAPPLNRSRLAAVHQPVPPTVRSFWSLGLAGFVLLLGLALTLRADLPMTGSFYTIQQENSFPGASPSISSSPALASTGSQSIAVVGCDYGTAGGALWAFDLDPINLRAEKRWSFLTSAPFKYSSPTIDSTNRVIYAVADKVYAVDLDSTSGGSPTKVARFSFPNGAHGSPNASPALRYDGVVYVASDDGHIYALRFDPSSGYADSGWTLKWNFTIKASLAGGELVTSSPAIASDGTIYFTTADQKLHALTDQGSQAAEKWLTPYQTTDLLDSTLHSSVAIGDNGLLYVGAKSGDLLGLKDMGTSVAVQWRFNDSDPNQAWFLSSPALGQAGRLVVGRMNKTVYCLDRFTIQNGSPRVVWSSQIGNFNIRSSPAIDSRGNTYICGGDGTLYAFDASGGNPAPNSFSTFTPANRAPITSSPAILSYFDPSSATEKPLIVYGMEDGRFFAVRAFAGLAPLSSAPWPMFRKDASHSAVGSVSKPVIRSQPQDAFAAKDSVASFSVVADGVPDPTYTWLEEGVPVLSKDPSNQTASTPNLSVSATLSRNGHVFSVIVSNIAGSVTSTAASLNIGTQPHVEVPNLFVDNLNRSMLSTLEDTTTNAVLRVYDDGGVAPSTIQLRATSSDQTLVQDSNLVVLGSGADRTLVVQPVKDANTGTGGATVEITLTPYRVTNGITNSGPPAVISMTILPVNDPPTINPIQALSMNEGSATNLLASGMSAGPLNEAGQNFIIQSITSSDSSVATVTAGAIFAGTSTLQITAGTLPPGIAQKQATITLTVADTIVNGVPVPGQSLSTSISFVVVVNAVNAAPTLTIPPSLNVRENDNLPVTPAITVADSDAGNNSLRLSLTATNGTLTFGNTTGISFLPGFSNSGSNVVLEGGIANLNAVLQSLFYAPNPYVFGTDTIRVTIDDKGNTGAPGPLTAQQQIPVSIQQVAQAPSILPIPDVSAPVGQTTTLTFSVFDPDTPVELLSVIPTSQKLTVIQNNGLTVQRQGSNFVLSIRPVAVGTAIIKVRVTDNTALFDEALFNVVASLANTPPRITNLQQPTPIREDALFPASFAFAAEDSETLNPDALSVAVSLAEADKSRGNLKTVASGGGTYTVQFTPGLHQYGTFPISISVSDGVALTNTSVTVLVLPTNYPPVISGLTDQQIPATNTSGIVSFAVSDIETAFRDLDIRFEAVNPAAGSPVSLDFVPVSFDGTNVAAKFFLIPGAFASTDVRVTVRDSGFPTGVTNSTSQVFRLTIFDPRPVISKTIPDATVIVGATTNFTVYPSGSQPFTYQWQFKPLPSGVFPTASRDIPGATSANLILNNIVSSDEGFYSVIVSNAFGAVTSAPPVRLTVIVPPTVGIQPTNQTTQAGASSSFFVSSGTGTLPVTFSWFRQSAQSVFPSKIDPLLDNNYAIASTPTNSTLTVKSPGIANHLDTYFATLANAATLGVNSEKAILTVRTNTPPTISLNNVPTASLNAGTVSPAISFVVNDAETPTLNLRVSAASSNPQVVPNGALGIKFTGPFNFLWITNLPASAGTATITLTVEDTDGGSSSASFPITFVTPNKPPILTTPASTNIVQNTTVSLPFTVADESPATVKIVASSSNTDLIPDTGVSITANNANPALLTVTVVPNPNRSGDATLTLRATDDGNLQGTPVTFTVTILAPPTILSQPANRSTKPGDTVTFTVAASGSAPLAYQWRFNAQPIAGASGTNYTLVGVTPANAGNYDVIVSNAAGSVTSAAAKLTLENVNLPPTVEISYPQNGSLFTAPAQLKLTARAQDQDVDGIVTNVVFLVGTNLLGSVPQRPFTLDTTFAKAGTYVLTAIATDNLGASTTSAPVTIIVLDGTGLPTLSIDSPIVTEGNPDPFSGQFGQTPMVFTVTLSALPTGDNTITVRYATSDGTAQAGSDYLPTSGTLTWKATSPKEQQITVTVVGDNYPDGDPETLFVNLLDPKGAIFANAQGTGFIQDDDNPVTVAFEALNVSAFEGNDGTTNVLTFAVRLSDASGQPISVDFATRDGTATAGKDYLPRAGTLTFAPGETRKTISVPIIGDNIQEADEQFALQLLNPVNGLLVPGVDVSTGTIKNDDTPPSITVADLQVPEGNSGTTFATFHLNLNSPAGQTISVNFTTVDGTARAGIDYLATNGVATFAPEATTATVNVPILGNILDQPDRTFTLKLSNASGAALGRTQALATIQDDDPTPSLTVVAIPSRVFEGASGTTTNITFSFILNLPSGQPVSVDYATADETATSGQDYLARNGTVIFQPGQTTNTVAITINGDNFNEGNETFLLKLSNPQNVRLSITQARGTILDDDAPPVILADNLSVPEGSNGPWSLSIPIRLSAPSGQRVTVDYTTANGTATAPSDYTGANGTLTFEPGQTNAVITLVLNGDTVVEPDESLTISLGNPINATLDRAQITITLLNDDAAPNLPPTIESVADRTINLNTTLTIPITITDPDTDLSLVTLNAVSDNPTLTPAAGITLTGTGSTRSLTVIPATGQTGTATFNLTANDGVNSSSRTFKLFVSAPNTPPTITAQPVNRTVLAGTSVSFSVTATGSAPMNYQWRLNGTNLASAIAPTLTLVNVQPAQSGNYSVLISNGAGAITSSNALLTVGKLGAQLWNLTTAKPVRSSPAIAPDGTLYVGSDDGKLYALTPTGTVKWTFAANAEIYSSPAIASDGTIYVGSLDHTLYAINPDGNLRWAFETGGEIYSSPAIASDGTLYVGSYDFKLHAITPTGFPKWTYTTGNTIAGSPSIGRDGTIYVGSQDRHLHAVNPDGTVKWTFLAASDIITSPAIAADGTLYVGGLDNRLYALNPDGTSKWQFAAGNSIRSSPAIASDGTVYFGTDDGKLYAVGSDGRKKWEYLTGVLVFSSPAIGDDGTVYVGSFDRKLHAVAPTGIVRWTFATDGEIYSSPAVDRDGVVYFGSFDSKIYAIKGTTGLAISDWPMFRRNLQHLGRADGTVIPATRPTLQTPAMAVDGSVTFSWATQAGLSYAVEAASDPGSAWVELTTLTAQGSSLSYRDAAAIGKAQRYYRIRIK